MFLAITSDEIQKASSLPVNIAYLGCHFSSNKPELEGLPPALPPGCGLILDDRNPIPDIEPNRIIHQLSHLDAAFILLDFQKPPNQNSKKLTAALSKLHCPVPMPPDYAKDLSCPVFLPPVPPNNSVEDHIAPWKHREIWLELALDGVQITVTDHGSQIAYFPYAQPQNNAHRDSMLHCHYKITPKTDALEFYCYRTKEDICTLLQSPLPSSVTHTIGLYQELWDI